MLYSKYRNKWRIYNEKIPRTVDNSDAQAVGVRLKRRTIIK